MTRQYLIATGEHFLSQRGNECEVAALIFHQGKEGLEPEFLVHDLHTKERYRVNRYGVAPRALGPTFSLIIPRQRFDEYVARQRQLEKSPGQIQGGVV